MTVKLQSLKANLDRETKGDWMDIPEIPGVRLNVSAITLPAYVMDRNTLFKKWARKYPGDKQIPPDEFSKGLGTLQAKHLIHGWEGFDEEYSADKALEYLADPAWRELMGHVENAATRLSQSNVEFLEDAEKNSVKRSVTK